MIKEDKIIVSVNARNIKYYRDLGYEVSFHNFTDKINLEVPIEQVSKFSKEKITAICQICSSETMLPISKYWRNYERGGYNFYSCFKCKNKKKEQTNLLKYGVESFSQTDEFKQKFANTCLEKYGVSNPNKLPEFREKIRETCIEKYGYTHAILSPEIIESNRIWMTSEEFKTKSKTTMMSKYGVDSFSKTDDFKKVLSENRNRIIEKMKRTLLEKYGVEHISKTDIWKKRFVDGLEEMKRKKIETCLERYGFENVSKVPDIMNKIMKSKIDKNLVISPELVGPWEKYKKEVRKFTKRNTSKLYENWNGVDFYDGESIKKYLGLSHIHRFYPTIDHKISVFYGFQNGISAEEISSLDNLCLTKRYLNSIKKTLIDVEFIEKLKMIDNQIKPHQLQSDLMDN